MQQNDWLSNRVTYIQALKKPSEQQELLALLLKNQIEAPKSKSNSTFW